MDHSSDDANKGLEFVKDDKGDKIGSNKEHYSKGIAIIHGNDPEDEREGWIDYDKKAVVYNSGHKFVKYVKKNKDLDKYNFVRVIISVIITSKNDHIPMDAIKTFEYFNKLLHEVWK